MKHLIAASFVTGALLMNFGYAVLWASMTDDYRFVFQGVWLLPSVAWWVWAIRRSRRLPIHDEPQESLR